MPVALEVVGWALLGAAALLLYRWLEQRAAGRALGPVEVEGKEESDVDRFRTYVLRNVPDPGASALQPVTDLLAATQVPTVIGKVLSAIAAALTQKRGYMVGFRVFAVEPAAGGKRTEIAVRVSKARNGELVEQEVADDPTKDAALRKAAYWAAAVVLDRSDRVPRWAQWSSETSESLAVFFSEPDRQRRELSQLEEAVRKAPTSGMLCLQLSNTYALESRHLDAFELALRPATLYPNFVAACYRLAMAASLVASDVGRNWWSRPPEQRERVLFALERFVASAGSKRRSRDELDSAWARLRRALRDRGGPDPSAARRELCRLALLELDHIEQLLRVHWILANALRRSERSYWIALLRPGRDQVTLRTQFRRAVASARPAVRERVYPGTTSAYAQRWQRDRQDWRNDPRTFWQVAYNLACWQGIRHREGSDTAEAAIGWLETAVERPNSHQLTRSWVTTDPDLQSLRRDVRFQQLVDNLPSDRRADGGDA